jgi:hypothetical protein
MTSLVAFFQLSGVQVYSCQENCTSSSWFLQIGNDRTHSPAALVRQVEMHPLDFLHCIEEGVHNRKKLFMLFIEYVSFHSIIGSYAFLPFYESDIE